VAGAAEFAALAISGTQRAGTNATIKAHQHRLEFIRHIANFLWGREQNETILRIETMDGKTETVRGRDADEALAILSQG
jgi:hypothetical protein